LYYRDRFTYLYPHRGKEQNFLFPTLKEGDNKKMKAKIKILMVVLIFSVFCVWAEWERRDIFLLPEGINGVNGVEPHSICLSEDNKKVFVANRGSNSVSIIDLANNNQVINVEVGPKPVDICTRGDKIFVVNRGNWENGENGSVSIIDLANGNYKVVNVEVGRIPRRICINGEKVFVTNWGSDTVSIIDLANNNRVVNVAVGDRPTDICSTGDKVFVATMRRVFIIDVTDDDHEINNLLIGGWVESLCLSRDNKKIFVGARSVGNNNTDAVVIIDITNEDYESVYVEVEKRPDALCPSEDNKKLFIAHWDDMVSIIDLADNNRVTSVSVDGRAKSICSVGDKIFVSNEFGDTVSVIDVNTHEVVYVEVGAWPEGICTSGEKVFVANRHSHSVSIIDVVDDNYEVVNVPVGITPWAICSWGNKEVFVANRDTGNVSLIDVTTGEVEEAVIGVRSWCNDICTSGDKVFTSNWGKNNVSIIDLTNNNQVVNVPVGKAPSAICISEDNKKVFVANRNSHNVSIIDVSNENYEVVNVQVGYLPSAICSLEDKVFVANERSRSISVIDLANNNRVTPVRVGYGPIAIYASENKVFTANRGSDDISIIDVSNENYEVVNVEVGDAPFAISASGEKVCVACMGSGLSIVDLTDNNRVIHIGAGAGNIWTSEDTFFVADTFNDRVLIIDAADENYRMTEIPVGRWPYDICASGGKVFTANFISGSITILSETSRGQNLALPLVEPELSSYPNPFNPECYIPVGKMENGVGRMRVKIYNILGQLVREINCSNRSNHLNRSNIYWDGRDSRGLEVSAGVYFYEVDGERVRRMVVLK
jgi:YVTN family beta-propeller protein